VTPDAGLGDVTAGRSSNLVDSQILIRGWRRLGVRRRGPRCGAPVFLMHGMPGSRLSARPSQEHLEALGVQLVTYDRPGYGMSDPLPGRLIADSADDVRIIADAFGFDTFAVIGRSGGGPHALACAALLPDRVTRAASLVGLAPRDASGLDWLQGMLELNRRHYIAAMHGRQQLSAMLYPQVIAIRSDPEHLVRRLESEATAADAAALSDPQYRAEMVETILEAVTRSLDGWIADSLAVTGPWGFDPAWIKVPTLLWHGSWDVFSPVAHTRWLAERVPGSLLLLSERRSHLNAPFIQHSAIYWLLHGGVPQLEEAIPPYTS
jgi:pimeloyl-ACP methyl ester carboxylesterase